MSTQDTAALIESVNNMTATVAGKMGEIDQRVVIAEQEFDEFQNIADARYYSGATKNVRVDGDEDKFYPVIFKLTGNIIPSSPESDVAGRVNYFHFLKYVHDHKTGDGYLRFIVDVATHGWGGYPSYLEPSVHDYSQQPFVGNYRYGSFGYFFVIWLRGGGRTYVYQSSWGTEPTVIMERTNLMTISHSPQTATQYPDWAEPETTVNAGVVANGFRR